MIQVAVVGASGYVGGALCTAFARDPRYHVTAITRATYAQWRPHPFDLLINAAMPSGRFWAATHPHEDFVETVQKTADLVEGWTFQRFVQISTVSARCQLETVYGRHKAAAEKLCAFGANLIVRLGPMYSAGLTKGVLVDLLHGRTVFVDGESRYAFAPLEFVSAWIVAHLDRSGVVEVGARTAIRLREVANHLGAPVTFEGAVDHQEIQCPVPEFPDARDVLRFVDEQRPRISRA